MKSLTEFAKARSEVTKCKVCNLAKNLRTEVEAGIKEGIGGGTVSAWLRNNGVKISTASITRHRQDHMKGTR